MPLLFARVLRPGLAGSPQRAHDTTQEVHRNRNNGCARGRDRESRSRNGICSVIVLMNMQLMNSKYGTPPAHPKAPKKFLSIFTNVQKLGSR